MGLEAATFIHQLNAAWPTGPADPKSQGDDHIRLLKSALQASFPNITGAMTLSHTQLNNAAQVNVANVFTQPQAVNVGAGSTGQVKLRGTTTPDPGAFNSYYDSTDVRRGWIGYGAADSSLRINNEIAAGELRLVTNGGVIRLNGVDAADYARLSQANVFASSITTGGNITVANGDPTLEVNETDASANNKRWLIVASGEDLFFQTLNDAGGAGTAFMQVTRTGIQVDTVTLGATSAIFANRARFQPSSEALGITGNDAVGDCYLAFFESQAFATRKAYFGFGNAGDDSMSLMNEENSLLQLGTNSTARLVIEAGGQVYGTGIHNNAGGASGATNGYIASGTYTPTYTGLSNVDSLVHIAAQWMRVGNVVTVSGAVTLDATAATTFTNFRITLPIASNLANAGQLSGLACPSNNSAGPVSADTALDLAVAAVTSAGAGALTCNYHFTYLVA